MKWVSFILNGEARWGYLDQNTVYPAKDGSLLDHINNVWDGEYESQGIPADRVQLLPPIEPIRNIICVGRNYVDHVKELNNWDSSQQDNRRIALFTKATTAINAPYADIPLHADITSKMDYEVELAVIIGKSGCNIPESQALEHIFGYTIMNDVSARDIQQADLQWFKSKSLDGCAPMGPCIVSRDAIADPHDLAIESRVNGEVRQSSNTKLMMFKIPEIIATLSKGMTLLPGDIITTGTPAGVGMGMEPPQYLKDGDEVICTIEGIGVLQNRVTE